ncbi:MAG: hypothetical protein ACRET5_12385 [Steroidobacteraceae bacterium]
MRLLPLPWSGTVAPGAEVPPSVRSHLVQLLWSVLALGALW